MSIDIIGAGLAGLLAGNLLKHHDPTIYEKQPSLPNNHSAVLRFRSSIVGDATNIPFRKVSMLKATEAYINPVADALAYSFKCTGEYRSDRSIRSEPLYADRWIAPSDFIARLAANAKIQYEMEFDPISNSARGKNASEYPVISTIPMLALMNFLEYDRRPQIAFRNVPGTNIRATIENCDAYISLLVPDPNVPFSRISITGDELIIEVPGISQLETHEINNLVHAAVDMLSIDIDAVPQAYASPQAYFKILPIDEDERRRFMFWATDRFNIFSLGRYATWRPILQLDDLIKDIRLIDGWITKRDSYEIARNR